MTQHIEATGTDAGWSTAYHLFTAARGLLFFTVIILIGAGWSYMKVCYLLVLLCLCVYTCICLIAAGVPVFTVIGAGWSYKKVCAHTRSMLLWVLTTCLMRRTSPIAEPLTRKHAPSPGSPSWMTAPSRCC